MLPDFLVVGAHKSGSTSLCNYLCRSKNISMYNVDQGVEIKFFSKKKIYAKGIDWYESLFEKYDPNNLIGEKSITYLASRDAPKRIHKAIPQVKLVFIFRNPVDRAYSHYYFNIQHGTEIFGFKYALKMEKFLTRLGGFFYNNYSYARRGLYYDQIIRFLEYFPIKQMHFLLLEDLHKDPVNELKKLCHFLNTDSNFLDDFDIAKFKKKHNFTKIIKYPLLQFPLVIYNNIIRPRIKLSRLNSFMQKLKNYNFKEGKYPPMKKKTREKLLRYFNEHNTKLAKLINKDLSVWDK